jgi:D-alanyl-D-alanine carboxypeptidase
VTACAWRAVTATIALVVGCEAPSPLDGVQPGSGSATAVTDLPARFDAIAKTVLADTGVPSASIAVVSDGHIIYARAFGDARLAPDTLATPAMRYPIGSISKQFTAAAILLLAEDGKLGLDDPVGRYIPGLTRGDAVTIRQVLSHTSGYRDYAPQDYMVPEWSRPIATEALLARWAHAPLDFEPGTQWQYSNTNFVIAAAIVQAVAGEPLVAFLRRRVFDKLGMTSVFDRDGVPLPATDAQGYFRRAGGPAHAAPLEAAGWYVGAAELAMTAEDLARWDESMVAQTVLAPASYRALETEVLLANGAGTRYGLGVVVSNTNSRRHIAHSGEVSGFVADNVVLPDDGVAIVVLTNQDASEAASRIAARIEDAMFATRGANADADRRVAAMLDELSRGELDRGRLTGNASAYFSREAIDEYKAALAAAGRVDKLEQMASGRRGGMTWRSYIATCASQTLTISVYETDDGKLEQFLIDR